MSLIKDRAAGVLIGLAAGDTIGGPVRMAHLLAQRLLAQQAFNADDVRQQYLTWWRDDGFDTGPTAAHVFELIEGGMSPEGAVRQVHEWHNRLTAGCNPAHRAPVMAAAAFLPDETLFRHAADEAALTHYDPLAGEVSAAVVMLCRALIRGVEWDDACKAVAGKLPPRTADLLTTRTTVEKLHAGGYAPHVLQGAVHFVGKYDSFIAALRMSVRLAGWGNYVPVLVGAIGGARWGMSSIPGAEVLNSLDILPDLHATAGQLAAGWDTIGG